jgi:ATP/maltotriose-dependent transcriptional regulator MalT
MPDSHPATASPLLARALVPQVCALLQSHKLCLCIAPAGYGKSALLEMLYPHLQQRGPLCLLRLTRADNTPLALLKRLTRALPPPASGDAVLPSFNGLLEYLQQQPCTLLLDDFHLADSAANSELCARLLDLIPPTVHILLSARSEPGFSYNKLLLSGQAQVIDLDRLRFSAAETARVLAAQSDGRALPEPLVATIFQRTEGWPVAVGLCALLLKKYGNADFLRGFSGRDLYLSNYLNEQVMLTLPDVLCRFCAQMSHFEQFSVALANAALDIDNAQAQVDELYRTKLFIDAVDRNNTWFRLHPMFREYLQSTRWQPDTAGRQTLFRRASAWAVRQHLPVQAIDYAIAAGDFGAVTHLLNESAQAFIRDQGLLPKLIEWCEKIPIDPSPASLHLHFWLAWSFTFSCLYSQAGHSISQLQQQIDSSRSLSRSERHQLQGRIRSISLALAIFSDNSDWTFREAEQWLATYTHSADPFDISVVAGGRFLSARLLLNASEARQSISTAKFHIARAHSSYGSMWINALDGLCEMEFGDYRVARHILQSAYDTLRELESEVSPIRSTVALLLAKTLYETGQVEQAHAILPDGLAHIDKHGLTESATAGITLEFRLALQRGPEHALYSLSKAEFLTSRYTPRLRFLLHKLRTELLLRSGDTALALAEASRAGVTIADDDILLAAIDSPLIQAEKQRLGILLLFHLGKYSRALPHITALLNDPATPQRALFYIDALLLSGALLLQTGDPQQACRQLTKALKKALTSGLLQIFIDQQALLEPVLKELLKRRQRAALLEEDSLMLQLEQTLALSPDHSAGSGLATQDFSERERELLRLLPSPLSVQEIADYVFLSKATIKWHLHNIYRKLGVKNRTGAIEAAARQQLLAP